MKEPFSLSEIPSEMILNHPLVQELSDKLKTNFGGIELPLILKDKILMDTGTWNNYVYSSEVIKEIFNSTDWTNPKVRQLFYDHVDVSTDKWIGYVLNQRLDGGTVRGDLAIYDLNAAIKIGLGKPDIGISPRVFVQELNGKVKTGLFENFSLVINPAVKTAYINNMEAKMGDIIENAQITGMEEKRKQLGMSVSEFYAIPRDPPSESKLPIFDEAHVRNAMARFNQMTGVSPEEKASAKSKINAAAKKFGINVKQFAKELSENISEFLEENKLEEKNMSEEKTLSEKDKDEMASLIAVKLAENAKKDEEAIKKKEEEKKKEYPEPQSEEMQGIKDISDKAKKIRKEGESWKDAFKRASKLEELSDKFCKMSDSELDLELNKEPVKPVEAPVKPEEKEVENKEITAMKEEISKLKDKMIVPDKITGTKAASPDANPPVDVDAMMHDYIVKNYQGVSINA